MTNTDRKLNMPKGLLKYVTGDATIPPGSNLRYLVHIVNDEGKFGAGFSGALARRWPAVESNYRQWWRDRYGKLNLGDIQEVQVKSDLVVINMVGQKGIVSKENPKPFKPEALRECLKKVAKIVSVYNSTVHMPRIGARLAGGNWEEEIEPIIKEELIDKGLNVVVYDLEKK
jgi:O-acetyl-ADP-ribose deacetylase (regulator of RNase III)